MEDGSDTCPAEFSTPFIIDTSIDTASSFLDIIQEQFFCTIMSSNSSEETNTSPALRGYPDVEELMSLLTGQGYPTCGALNLTREQDGLAVYRAEVTESRNIVYIVVIMGCVFIVVMCLNTRRDDLERARLKDKEDLDRARAKEKEDLDRARLRDLDEHAKLMDQKVLDAALELAKTDKLGSADAAEVLKTFVHETRFGS